MSSEVIQTVCCFGCGQFFDKKWLETHQIDECSLELLMSDTVDVPELLKQQASAMENNQQSTTWKLLSSKATAKSADQVTASSHQKQKLTHDVRPVAFRGGTYTGDMSGNQRHGFGVVMTFTNGDLYTGRWFDNSRHFHGIMKYANGDEYDGNWDTGKRSGLGKLTCSNGETYSGEWMADAVFGRGVMKYANGNEHEGQWSGGKPHGTGKITFMNGDTFTGSWVNGKRKGAGCMECADGAVIDSEWLDGVAVIVSHQSTTMKVDTRRVLKGEAGSSLRSGHHCVTYANGDLYTGSYQSGCRSGTGTQSYGADGSVYGGEWRDDQPNGHGTLTYRDGQRYVGQSMRCGRGTEIYGDGSRYEGEFLHDLFDGYGVRTQQDGKLTVGVWRLGQIESFSC